MSIFVDKKNGKLTGRYRVEIMHEGRRWRKRFNSFKDAQQAEKEWKELIAKGLDPLWQGKTFTGKLREKPVSKLQDLAEIGLWRGQKAGDQTQQRFEKCARILGPTRLIDGIQEVDYDRLVAYLKDLKKAPGTINRYLAALSGAMKWARVRKFRSTVAPQVPWQKEEEGRIRFLSHEEETTLLEHLQKPYWNVVKLALATGMRRQEILKLERRDLEPGWVRLWKTKTSRPRSIPITPETYQIACELFDLGMPGDSQLTAAWNDAKLKMGLGDDEQFVFHMLRHTFATRAVMAGVHVRVIMSLMGHSNIATTQRYMQMSDSMLEHAIHEVLPRSSSSPSGGLKGSSSPLKEALETKSRPNDNTGLPRGRGEIGRHAGFRFLSENAENMSKEELLAALKAFETDTDNIIH